MTVIHVENLWKQYRLGVISHGTLHADIQSWWARIRGKEDPNTKISPMLKDQDKQVEGDRFWALKKINFEVKRGEILGIIGRNGAGKSTLLKILSRVTTPTMGAIKVKGRIASLLEVGTGFHPELTGRENIFLNGAILGMTKDEITRKLDEIIDFSGVEQFVDTPTKRYSSGMYVRLAFAVAAHLEPEILVVDEVLAVGDFDFQNKCIGKMEKVAGEGRTVLFVSHNMAAVRRLCTRALLLHHGEVLCDGPVKSVIEKYIGSGLSSLGERVWLSPAEAPGNDVARLKAIRALDAEGMVVKELSVHDDFFVEIEFWVLESGTIIDAGIHLMDDTGRMLIMAGDFQNPGMQGISRKAGIHRSRCRIPGDLLNEGKLFVDVWLCTNPHTLHARERDALVVDIKDNLQTGGARGNYTEQWPSAAVRPLLEWDCQCLCKED